MISYYKILFCSQLIFSIFTLAAPNPSKRMCMYKRLRTISTHKKGFQPHKFSMGVTYVLFLKALNVSRRFPSVYVRPICCIPLVLVRSTGMLMYNYQYSIIVPSGKGFCGCWLALVWSTFVDTKNDEGFLCENWFGLKSRSLTLKKTLKIVRSWPKLFSEWSGLRSEDRVTPVGFIQKKPLLLINLSAFQSYWKEAAESTVKKDKCMVTKRIVGSAYGKNWLQKRVRLVELYKIEFGDR